MKIINILKQFKTGSLKTRVVIATAIIGITLVSAGGLNNVENNSSKVKYTQVVGSVYTPQYGVATASSLSVRSGAGINYSILGSLKSGTKITITGKTNDFYKINYNGKLGYISVQHVKITAKPVEVYVTQYGVTTASILSIRSGAGTTYSIVGSLKNGTKIIITGKTNDFYKINYNGKLGYISVQHVKITAKPVVVYVTQFGVTTASDLSIRSGAGTTYSILGSLKSGTKIIITGKTDDFYKIDYNGKIGYISSQYVKTS